MGNPAVRPSTYAEYLNMEASAAIKYAFKAGNVYSMAGDTPAHARLVLQVGAALYNGLRGSPCAAYGSELKVQIDAADASYYADAAVICGPLVCSDLDGNAITNPTVLVEVLSRSTEAFDRGEKFDDYALLPSLLEYVLVSTVGRIVEVWRRGPSGVWEGHRSGVGEGVQLTSINVAFAVDELYEGVELDSPAWRVR